MSKFNQPVTINGVKHWIRANSVQELANKIALLTAQPVTNQKHEFSTFAWNWYETFSAPNVEKATAVTYKRQLTLHLLPFFGAMAIEEITPDDIQRFFNGISGTKSTMDKVRMVLNQILEAAVDDDLIAKNPLKSRRIKIKGESNQSTAPYSVEQMKYLVQHLGDIKRPVDRAYSS